MNSVTPIPNVLDVNSLTSLKSQVKSDDPEALKAAAKQFEALFMQMVLKSMRDTLPHDSPFDSDQSRMYQSLLDQQLSQVLSSGKNGVGLAAMIEKQLTRKNDPIAEFTGGLPFNPDTPSIPLDAATLRNLSNKIAPYLEQAGTPPRNPSGVSERSPQVAPIDPAASNAGPRSSNDASAEFVAKVSPYALAAERQSGVPAHFMVAQAALETGWGKAEPRFADGRSSFNLFGIKAGRNWKGATVEASTLEYVDGQPQRQVERFRAYGSYAEAFADYANLISTNPRYSTALNSRDGAGFARAMQSAGYATDPQYASKLERIMASAALRPLNSA
jgi:flagellar protein FlgJ